jgi:putative PIN family toxin of toxin-antitoxin system
VRAVVDTNVWISALLNPAGAPAAVRIALQQQQFTLVTSEPLLEELAAVLARPRFAQRYGVTPADIAELVALLRERGEVVPIAGTVRLCRDPDDDMVIETAFNGRADALVTRDDDLKGVEDLTTILASHGVAVLTVRRFLAALGDE